MTQVYFLIPGLLLPEAARPFLSAETLAVAERITRAAAGDAVTQVLTALRPQVCIWRGSGGCLRESPCRLPQLPTPGLWIRGRNFRAKSGACTLLTMTARHLRTWTAASQMTRPRALRSYSERLLIRRALCCSAGIRRFTSPARRTGAWKRPPGPCCAQGSLTGIAPWPRALMRRPTHYRKRRKR